MKKHFYLIAVIGILVFPPLTRSQTTTLVGDHLVTGNLSVGTSSTNRILTVEGNINLVGGVSGTVPLNIISADNQNIVSSFFGSNGAGFDIVISDEGLEAGYGVAERPAIGFGGSSFEVKYGSGSDEWGHVLFLDNHKNIDISNGTCYFDPADPPQQSVLGPASNFDLDCSKCIAFGDATVGLFAISSAAISGGKIGDLVHSSVALSGGMAGNYDWDGYNPSFATALSGGGAQGDYSVAMGLHSRADAAYSVVVGRFNETGGNGYEWVDSDPLFVVGNGTGDLGDAPEVTNRNAFTVYKNGDVKIAKRQGDVLMGEFGNPE